MCGIALAGSVTTVDATERTPVATSRSTHEIVIEGEVRHYLEAVPTGVPLARVPIVVFLHGSGATPNLEIHRDGMLPLVGDGLVELVYPAGIDDSWDAGGGCCGRAGLLGVNDVAFLESLVAHLDPGRTRPIYLGGYSNGARMTYAVICEDPTLVDGFVAVSGLPQPGCVVKHPVDLLQIAGTADPEVPYVTGDPGHERPPVTVELARLRTVDDCPRGTMVKTGQLALSSWRCAGGTRLELAAYDGGTHAWHVGNASTPSAASVIRSFVSGGSAP